MVAEEASVAATLAVVASKQVASMVADKWPVELVAAAEELALVARAFQVTLRTLLAQDPALFIRKTIVQAACLRRTTESSGNSLRWRNNGA